MASAFQFPLIDETTECALLVLPLPLLPFALGALGQLQAREYWQTDADWHAAYEAIAEIEANAMQSCVSDLIESNNRIYRLLDAAMFGRVYSVVSGDPLEIEPAIPDVPDMTAINPGLVSRIALIEKCLDNAMNGTQYTEFSATPGIRQKLQELIDIASQQGQLDDEMLGKLIEIAALMA